MLKRMMALAVTVAMVFCLAAPALALDDAREVPVKVFVDEEELILPDGMSAYAAVSEKYGYVEAYYPLRPIVEALGGTMEWDAATRTAIVKMDDMTIYMPADSDDCTLEGENWSESGEYFDHFIKNGITYVSDYSDIFGWIADDYSFDEESNLYLTSMSEDSVSKTSGKVVLNGKELVFPEGLQVIRYDMYAAYVPLRYVMEKLGAKVTWDAAKSSAVVVKDDAKITVDPFEGYFVMEISGEIVYEGWVNTDFKDGTVYMDVDQYWLTERLGINTGFDESTGAVLIDDADIIMQENKASYNVINSYLAYHGSLRDSGYSLKEDLSFELGITDVEIDCPQAVSLTGTAEALVSKTAADMSMLVNMDITQLLNVLREESPDDESLVSLYSIAEHLKNATLDVNYDLSKGKMHLRSNLLGLLGISQSTWVEIDAQETLGVSLEELLSIYNADLSSVSVRDIIKSMVEDVYLYDENNTGKDLLDEINSYISDAAFTKNGMSYVTSGELDMDGIVLKYSFTVPMQYGRSTGGTLKLSIEDEDITITASEKLKDGRQVETVEMTMDDGETKLTVKMDINAAYEKTSKQPQGIPDDATVITLEELMEKLQ